MRTLKRMQPPGAVPLRQEKQRGFTLIEVILALAIFMLGAVAIVRIFPPALASIQGSGDQTNGARLASSTLERLDARVSGNTLSSVPDAIYFGSRDGIYNTAFSGAFSGTTNRNSSLPRNAQLVGNGNPANDSALKLGTSLTNSGSFVSRERHRIMSESDGSLFILTNFSYDEQVKLAAEDIIEGARVRDVGTAGAPKYVFDFSNATLASTGASWSNTSTVDPSAPLYPAGTGGDYIYYISYRWVEANGSSTVHGVDSEPYVFPAPSTTGADALKTVLSDRIVTSTIADRPQSIVEGEVTVRMIRKVGTATATGDGDAMSGLVEVPSGSGLSAGDTVLASYGVRDWRNIMTDQVPVNSSITLTTRGLDEANYGDEIAAVIYNAPDVTGKTKALVRQGYSIPSGDGTCAEPGDALAEIRSGGSETNRVRFESGTTGVGGLTAPRARFAYRAQNGWGVQAAVAARTYIPYLDFNPKPAEYDESNSASYGYKREPWREYSWKPGGSNLYFQPNEAGKIVSVTFQYRDTNGLHLAKDRIVTINEDLQSASSADVRSGFTGAGGNVAIAELTDLDGNYEPNVTSILSVKGLSIQARGVWADNQGRYRQAVVTDYRKSS